MHTDLTTRTKSSTGLNPTRVEGKEERLEMRNVNVSPRVFRVFL